MTTQLACCKTGSPYSPANVFASKDSNWPSRSHQYIGCSKGVSEFAPLYNVGISYLSERRRYVQFGIGSYLKMRD